jgi:hypothetical protein
MIEFLFLAFGIVIGYNIRNSLADRKENLILEQVDADIRNELAIAKNLNKSLLSDVRFLRDKIARMKNEL